jgi:hypothetical protein
MLAHRHGWAGPEEEARVGRVLAEQDLTCQMLIGGRSRARARAPASRWPRLPHCACRPRYLSRGIVYEAVLAAPRAPFEVLIRDVPEGLTDIAYPRQSGPWQAT